jgi:uncharacterized membrane protein SpoIIM required for sporulation
MKEIVFIERNSHRWKEFETLLKAHDLQFPDVMSDLFIQITDDLAYSRTHYPESNVTQYLNSLAMLSHQGIYRNKKVKKNRMVVFWKTEYPLLLHANMRYIVYSMIVFVVAFFIGLFSAANDAGFVRLIMGDSYVNMTIENIHKGDPLAVYKQVNSSAMFLGITINNVFVAFRTVVLGLIFIVGSVLSLLQNGIMVGAFQYFFYQHHLLKESILTIYLHGTLELFSIIMAGAAGILFGSGFMFPGTYSRYESFKRNVVTGAKLLIGIIPLFIVAGFIEGFITRQSSWPEWIKLAIIIGSALFIMSYFFLYPYQLSKSIDHGKFKN